MRPTDPRVVATYNRITSNLESVNITTQSYLYSASQRAEPYVSSCLATVTSCLEASCQPCFNLRDEHFRRRGYHTSRTTPGRRGREGLGFDFYDDWEQEEADWANDELERLLSGGEEEVGGNVQPGKHPKMNYGSRLGGRPVGKRKGGALSGKDAGDDPKGVPQSSMFGFLERLPWKIGGRGTGRYRPSVAGLEEGVGRRGGPSDAERILYGEAGAKARKGRGRSETAASRSSNNSLSSRGDLFPSDDEDAVPIDDEFAMALERRPTGATTSDDHSSRKKGEDKSTGSRSSTKTTSSKETRGSQKDNKRDSSISSRDIGGREQTNMAEEEGEEEAPPSMSDLKLEEERIGQEEDSQIEERRQAAHRLALERGLSATTADPTTDVRPPSIKAS